MEVEPWRREQCYVLDWAAFGGAVETIAERTRTSYPPIEAIVAIARGGLIPGGALANLLDVREVLVCSVRRNDGTGEYLPKREPTVEWSSSLAPLEGRSVLVVDDVAGTGATIDLVRDRCLAAWATSVTVAAPVVMAAARSAVDIAVHELDDWVVFPWEARPYDRRTVSL